MSASQPTIEELSQQIGLVDSHPPALADEPSDEFSDSLEDYLEAAPAPEQFTTKPTFYNTGVSKAALVGGVGLVLFLGGASLFKVASPGGKAETVAEAEVEEAPEDPTLTALRQSQAAEAKAKAKLALLDQNQSLEPSEAAEAVEADTTAEGVQDGEAQELEATTDPVATTQPAPPPPAPLPPAKTYTTVAPTPKPTVTSKPTVTPVALTPKPTATAPLFNNARGLNSSLSVNQPDPLAEMQRLASLGTYGEVELSERGAGGADANARVAALFPGAVGLESAVIKVDSSDPDDAFGAAATAAPLSDYFERSAIPIPVEPAPVALTKAEAKTAEPLISKFESAAEVTVEKATDVEPATVSELTPSAVASAIPNLQRTAPTGEANPPKPPIPVFEPAVARNPAARRSTVQRVSTVTPPIAQPAVLAQQPERTILVGSSAQGSLMTPVIWAPDGARGEARFIVRLNQPILDAQGQEALPKDTQFVVAAQNLDTESGLVDLTVMALVIDGQEYEAPEGIFSVRDRQGGLLLGELRNQPNQGRGDTARVLTGALAQVGRLMNRPRSTSTSRSNGSFGSSESSTTQNDDPNYVGAVLEGGFEEFASVMEERQKAAAEALAQAPQLYQLSAGHPIQIFINQSLIL